MPEFSIVILTKNSLGVVEDLVQALLKQDFTHPYEIIFMDNDSRDHTVTYLENTPFLRKKIIHVPEGQFSHSLTRMQAAREASGEYIIFFTDDIKPLGENFLTQLVEPVLNKDAQASYGVFQINPETCDPIDAYMHNSWYQDYDDIVEPIHPFYWNKIPPLLRRRLCNFDNCCSCMKRETLLRLEFSNVPYGEDMLFAKKLILNGCRVAIAKDAKFHHWHRVSFSYLMKRMCIDHHLSIREFDTFYVRRKLGVIRAILVRSLHRTSIALFKLKMPFSKKLYWILYNIKTLSADFLGKYIAVLTEEGVNKNFSPLNRRLFRLQREIIEGIEKKSILRY